MALLDKAYAERLLDGAVSNTLDLEYGSCGPGVPDREAVFLAKVTSKVWNGLLDSLKATEGWAACRRPERMVAELVRRGVLPGSYRMNGCCGRLRLRGGAYAVDKKTSGYTVDPVPGPRTLHLPACVTMDEREFAGFLLEFDAFRTLIAERVHDALLRQEAREKARRIMEVTRSALERWGRE